MSLHLPTGDGILDRREFNRALLAAGWAAAMGPAASAAVAAQRMTRIKEDIEAVTRSGGDVTIPKAALKDLQKSLRGVLLLPGNAQYDDARKVWNGMIDKRPGLIVRCTGAADVASAVNFAREFDLLVAVRGGGHSISGKAVCDGGIMIDLSPIRWCTVDPAARTARLGGGSLLGDLDHESQRFGLATPVGTVSHTGAAGLTLGGGHGRLSRSFGLTCDNVLSVDIVTADGEFRRASADENPELYWGVRGGGGNFGVVTAFEYRLHPIGTQIYGGPILYSFDQVRQILPVIEELTATAPRSLAADLFIMAPGKRPGNFMVSVCHVGDPAEAERVLAPLRKAMKPRIDQARPMKYSALQTSADAGTKAGRLYYNKSGLLRQLDTEFLAMLLDQLETGAGRADPGVGSNVVIQHLGGAVADVPMDGTAYAHRDARFDSVLMSAWEDPARNEENIAWLRKVYAQMEPSVIGYYMNHMVDSDAPKARLAFRDNYDRLVSVKNRYDPDNLFQLNANVKPSA
jgi:FAD/FMN-containing dehydrogenase